MYPPTWYRCSFLFHPWSEGVGFLLLLTYQNEILNYGHLRESIFKIYCDEISDWEVGLVHEMLPTKA